MESMILGQATFNFDEVNLQLNEIAEEKKLQAHDYVDAGDAGIFTDGDWVQDIAEMHMHFGVNQVVEGFDSNKLLKFLEFRLNFLQEELTEAKIAFSVLANVERGDKTKAADDVVDACIDLCVVAIGTMNALNVDAYEAWNRVHKANMLKNPGIKPERPNPLGLPDLIKPIGWIAPTHGDNIGLLDKLV